MEMDPQAAAIVAAVVFVLGLGMGWLFGRVGRTATRVSELESELSQSEARFASYRDGVAKHFDQTSHLFEGLTRQYSAVWEHLADGARSLCPERVPALGRGLNQAPLLTGVPPEGEDHQAESAAPAVTDAEGPKSANAAS